MDENNDGTNDWHFDKDSTFVLPDGTKIFCDTVKTGDKGSGAVSVSDMLAIQHGDSLAMMDVKVAGDSSLELTGGLAYDSTNDDGQVFVLADDGQWKDGETLGDLYDAGGDFVADVRTEEKGTISSAAQAVLAGGVAGGGGSCGPCVAP